MLKFIEKIIKYLFYKVMLLSEKEISDVYKMDRFREKVIMNVGGKLTISILIVFGIADFFKHKYYMTIIDFIIAFFIFILVFFYNRTNMSKILVSLNILILSVFMIFLFSVGDPEIYGFLFTLILPPYFVFFAKIKKNFFISLSYLAIQFAIYYLNLFGRIYTNNFIIYYCSIYIVITLIAIIVEWFREITYKRLLEKNAEAIESVNKLSETKTSLLASEAKYKVLVENNIDGIAIVRNDRFLYANPQLCTLLDYSKDELEQKTFSDLIPEKEIPKVEQHLLKKYVSENNPVKFETLIYNSNANEINVKIQKSNIIFNNEIAYLVLIKDIGERLKLEAEKLKVSKLNLYETFTDGITHDFNNLLTISLGYLEALNVELNMDKKASRYIKKIEDASKRAQSLLDDFKMLSSNEPLVKMKEDFYLILEASIKKLNPEDLFDIRLTKEDPIFVTCDNVLISIAVENIIKNSLDAIGKNGMINITLKKVCTENNDIDDLVPGNYVLLTIKDDGCGIQKENLTKVFDPYFSTKDHVTKKGMGFSLAITEKIILNHMGFIKVDSEESLSTTFSVYIPY